MPFFLLVLLAGSQAWAQAPSWKAMPSQVWRGQKAIWTSPLHIRRGEAKWWALFGGATAGFIAGDRWTAKQLPNTRDQIAVARWTSRLGYATLPATGIFYLVGKKTRNERLRETGLLSAEALADTFLFYNGIKFITERQRPLEGDGRGRFFQGGISFPSGHAAVSWTVASVVAHEYPRPRIIPAVAYGLAGVVSASRFAARQHFASDIVAGAAIGWFIGEYVFHKRHRRPDP